MPAIIYFIIFILSFNIFMPFDSDISGYIPDIHEI